MIPMAKNFGEPIELEVDGHQVRVTNPEKPYFPAVGITKLEVVQHYLNCGPGILRALMNRPTTLERWPGGVVEGAVLSTRADHRGDAFYQKRVPAGAPNYVETATITFPSGRIADEVAPNSLAVIAWAAQLGTVTFHPWPVRKDDVDHPDELRIDLDPQPGTNFDDARRVAFELKSLLDEFGVRGFVKTSGGRGLHIYVRILRRYTFIDVRHAAIAIGRELERRLPGRVTTQWWKENRGEAIFIDYNQNARDRTIASAYSIRARANAPVSMPITWVELVDVAPEDFTVRTAGARFVERGDAHAEIDDAAFDIARFLEWYDRDERDLGLGEMPYPPDYPKMAGEPSRVQPSRARLAD